jgi:CspA family cold shock protein
MPTGKVKWFNINKGYGFITPDEPGTDLFAHFKNIKMDGFKKLDTGDAVEFETEKTDKGWQAINIVPLKKVGA